MKKIIVMTVAALCLMIGNAHAIVVPTVDGLVGAGEWTEFSAYGWDVNEPGISNSWDIKEIWLKTVMGQGTSDGLYFRMDMYATPSYTGAPGSGAQQAYFEFLLDYDGDGVEDFYIDLNNQYESKLHKLGVYAVGSPDVLLGHGEAALGNIIEMYVPTTLLSNDIMNTPFQLFATADGRGSEGDDRLPGSGWVTTTPEPASMALLGLGLLGLGGRTLRKKFNA